MCTVLLFEGSPQLHHMPLMRRYRVEDSTVAIRHRDIPFKPRPPQFHPLTDYDDMAREKVAMNTDYCYALHNSRGLFSIFDQRRHGERARGAFETVLTLQFVTPRFVYGDLQARVEMALEKVTGTRTFFSVAASRQVDTPWAEACAMLRREVRIVKVSDLGFHSLHKRLANSLILKFG